MNCDSCRKLSGDFLSKSLPAVTLESIANHLSTCSSCSEFYKLENRIDLLVARDLEQEPGPFVKTRIMAAITNVDKPVHATKRTVLALKPVLITLSMAAAIYAGVLIGSILEKKPSADKLPVEMALIDDSVIESIPNLTND